MLMMRGVGGVRAEVDGVVGLVARIVWPPASVLVFCRVCPAFLPIAVRCISARHGRNVG
jgi:hypothetical protein